jgi:alpha-glucoside transport system substrate-binding protein
MQRQRRRWQAAVAAGLALTLLASACAKDNNKDNNASTSGGSSGNLKGKTVTIGGTEVETELQGNQDAFKQFTADTGIKVKISGDRSFDSQIGTMIDGGNAPDIALFPQPGKVKDFKDDIVTLPSDVDALVKKNFDPGFTELTRFSGDQKAVPLKADLKSVVWYSPKYFKAGGYEVPTTFQGFLDLANKMQADGKTPFCVGLGSDEATGWPFTDWVEDFMLRMHGPAVYDQWRDHKIPFNDPKVLDVGNAVYNLWAKPGMVYGGVKNVASTPFADAGLPLLKGNCLMHRQGNFYSANFPKGTKFGPDGDINAFYLPGSPENPHITLTGGNYAAALENRPEVMAVMKFMASNDYADARAPAPGFLSPNKNVNTSNYPNALTQAFGKILAAGNPVRFDASDMMPGAVGADSFWSAAVDITTGAKTVDKAFADVDKTWPAS